MAGPGRASFERPYGLAWLLQLAAELREWEDPQARQWAAVMRPLETAAAARLKEWLPKLSRPIRIGEHDQTAFAFGLVLDWARAAGDQPMIDLVSSKTGEFYRNDRACPLNYEPTGQDFLSPCIAEADLMRRVLAPSEFGEWLRTFLPQIPRDGSAAWLEPAVVTDPTDPKLAHLDGLNLSRAWMLDGIVSGLAANDPRRASLQAAADRHREAGLKAVTGEHYEGGHWLGSFAVYLSSGRGLPAGERDSRHRCGPAGRGWPGRFPFARSEDSEGHARTNGNAPDRTRGRLYAVRPRGTWRASHWPMRSPTSHIRVWWRSTTTFDFSRSS